MVACHVGHMRQLACFFGDELIMTNVRQFLTQCCDFSFIRGPNGIFEA